MEKRRVVITGMGVVAPNGIGVDNFWALPSFQPFYDVELRIWLKKSCPVLIWTR